MRNVRASSAAALASDAAMRAAHKSTVSATTATPFACLTAYRVAERATRRRDRYNARVDLKTIDAHVAGAAVRLAVAGLPQIVGDTLDERAQRLMASARGPLLALAREPRGPAGMVVSLLVAPDRPDADAGMLFVSGEDLLPFSGDALLAAAAIAVERGLVLPRREGRLEIDTLAGPATAIVRGASVSFVARPAIVLRPNHAVTIGRR